jgi:hypothetical protein
VTVYLRELALEMERFANAPIPVNEAETVANYHVSPIARSWTEARDQIFRSRTCMIAKVLVNYGTNLQTAIQITLINSNAESSQ